MPHFRLDEWADLARDVVDEQKRAAMLLHLEDGCNPCGETLQAWKRVYEVGRGDSAYEPPESALRSVRGAYAIHGLYKATLPKMVMARLLFDSFRDALPAGVRSSGASVRQLHYGAGAYEVDLRLEAGARGEKVSLIGQILNSSPTDQTVSGIPCAALRNGKVLTESRTNEFGEFAFEFAGEEGVELRFRPLHGTEFLIPPIEASRAGETSSEHDRPAAPRGSRGSARPKKKA